MRRSIALAAAVLLASCAGGEAGDCSDQTCGDAEGGPVALTPETDTKSETKTGADEKDDDGADDDGEAPPVEIDRCATNASPEEIAQTPRVHRSLELLAIAMDGTPVADPARYQRLVDDAAAIRALQPDANLEYVPKAEGIILGLTRRAWEGASAGTYADWECLNQAYGAEVRLQSPLGLPYAAVLTFPGAFELESVIADYLELDGVQHGDPNWYFGRSAGFCARDTEQGIVYLSMEEWGDCPSGCIYARVSGFLSTEPGAVEPLGTWESSETRRDPMPDWASFYRDC